MRRQGQGAAGSDGGAASRPAAPCRSAPPLQAALRWPLWSRLRLPLACACFAGGLAGLGLPVWSGWWTAHVQAVKSRAFLAQIQRTPPAAGQPASGGSPSALPASGGAVASTTASLPPPPLPALVLQTLGVPAGPAGGAGPAGNGQASGSGSAAPPSGGPSAAAARSVAPGDVLAELRIPAAQVDSFVLEGLTYQPAVWEGLLRQGPAHVLGSALPGQPGNVVIFGHLNIWGAVFAHLDALRPGDRITLITTWGTFTYRVTGSRTILPTDVEAVAPVHTGPATLELVTCEGLLDQHRLVVEATLAPSA